MATKRIQDKAVELVLEERENQDRKWGVQNHDPAFWLLILTEELGEVAKAALERNHPEYIKELRQLIAVGLAWYECELRRSEAPPGSEPFKLIDR